MDRPPASCLPPENFLRRLEPSRRPRRSPAALSILPSPSTTDDETLARAAANGSRAAFERLVDRYAGRVLATLERRLGDHSTAMDVAQETWIRVFRALPEFDANRTFRPWLFAIALNTARDEGRRQQRSPVNYAADQPLDYTVEQTTHHHDPTAHDDRQAIDRALLGVAEPYRTAIVLVDCEGFDYAEASQCCDCALGTMKSRVARGRAAFRDEWDRICGSGHTPNRKSQS